MTRPPPATASLDAYLRDGVLDAELAALVWLTLDGGIPIVVAGEPGVGRRALRDALLGLLPSGVRTIANIFSLILVFSAAASDAKWEATVTASSPPSFPGPRPMHGKYSFSWSGFPGATADVRLTKSSGDVRS